MAAEPRTIRHEFRSDAAIDAASLYARARQARSEAIAAAVITVFDRLRALAGRIARRRRDARARRELAALSDRSLADIGLNRLDVHRRDLSAVARERTRPANRNDAEPRAA
jgi:uncharacterized protein YjiS (DUF1127 family)